MKKVLIILGIVAAAGLMLLMLLVAFVVYELHANKGPVLYSCVGEWTRIGEYAHQRGNTNYIIFADGQLGQYQWASKEWGKSASASEISKCEKMQAEAYALMDKNIRNGLNPLAYLDDTNQPPATTAVK